MNKETIIISGKIIDETTKSPISGAKVIFNKDSLLYKSKATTDKDGVYQLKIKLPITVYNKDKKVKFEVNSFTEIQTSKDFIGLSNDDKKFIRDSLNVNFSKKKYSQNPLKFPFDGDGNWLKDLGLTELIPQKKQLDLDIAQVQLPSEAEKAIVTAQKIKDNIKIGGTAQLKAALRNLIKTIKKNLIPLILLLLAQFGITLDMVKKGLLDKVSCPDKATLLKIIAKRNKIVTQLNNLYKAVNTIAKVATLLAGFLSVLQIAIQIAKAIPSPAPSSTSAVLIALENKLGKIVYAIAGIAFMALIAAAVLKQIIDLLGSLDKLIQQCSQDQQLSLTAIDADLIKAANATNTQLDNEGITYKGFSLEIQEDTKDNNKYVKRYAVARDVSGVIVLRGESSFSASTQILIDELKFVIDRDNLKAF
jgi:hypothetical protein